MLPQSGNLFQELIYAWAELEFGAIHLHKVYIKYFIKSMRLSEKDERPVSMKDILDKFQAAAYNIGR